MGLISTSNYRVGKEYVFNITVGSNLTLVDKKVVVLGKGYKKLLLKIDDKEQWIDNINLSSKRSEDRVFKQTVNTLKDATPKEFENAKKLFDKPKVEIKKVEPVIKVAKPIEVKKQKVTHSNVVPKNKNTNEQWCDIHKKVMTHFREVLYEHGYENVYSLKPSELVALVDKNISDYVE